MKQFVEIGTSDFDTCHKLLDLGWKGLMVEPVKELFLNLPEHPNLTKVNCAISDFSGSIDMMVCLDFKLHNFSWGRGISHVIDDNHLGWKMMLDPTHENTWKEKRAVPCTTLDKLLFLNGIKQIDYLKIDVEGHELNILNNYTFDIAPTFIKCEHKHVNEEELIKILERQGYIVYKEEDDLYAVG